MQLPPAGAGLPGSPGPLGFVSPDVQALLYQQQMAALASQFAPQAASAQPVSQPLPIHDKVKELAKHFKLDDKITRDLNLSLHKRGSSFEEDMKALVEILKDARNPAGLLRVKIREMDEGTFRGTATPDKDVEDLAKKFHLDAQAAAKLAEVLSRREDRKKDLRQIAKHLELSNRPSSLVMLMLKDLRAGIAIKDPEYPAAVGSYVHKRGMKRPSRSRSRGGKKKTKGGGSPRSDSSSSPPPASMIYAPVGAKTAKAKAKPSGRPMTLLERFG